MPPSAIRTLGGDGPLRFAFGSCRVSLPHHGPYTLPKGEHPDGREFDALYSLVEEMLRADPGSWPQALLMLGDQVYADEVSPETLAFIRKRRDTREPPGEEVADFEEYTRLYRESWEDPNIRWLLSTVSVSMVIDDHDIHDDWNISAAWVEDMRELDWWAERECSGIASYWLYQFIGNLSPELLRESELLARVRAADDGWEVLREFAANERGRARRRPLELLPRPRADAADRDRLADRAGARRGPPLDAQRRRVGVAGAAPARRLRPPADRHLRSAGAGAGAPSRRALGRGGRAAVPGASARRPRARSCGGPPTSTTGRPSASRSSGSPGCSRRSAPVRFGEPPATITVLSGDVHHAYLAELAFPRSEGVRSHVWQAVCSPFRNALDDRERKMIELGDSRIPASAFRGLARLAGVDRERVRWRLIEGPFYDNQVATLTLEGRDAAMVLERTVGDPETDHRELHTSFERSLT